MFHIPGQGQCGDRHQYLLVIIARLFGDTSSCCMWKAVAEMYSFNKTPKYRGFDYIAVWLDLQFCNNFPLRNLIHHQVTEQQAKKKHKRTINNYTIHTVSEKHISHAKVVTMFGVKWENVLFSNIPYTDRILSLQKYLFIRIC